MDVFSLLSGIRLADESCIDRKQAALNSAYKAAALNELGLSVEQFLRQTPPLVLSTQFGSAAEDAYLTGMLSTVGRHDREIDLVLAGVLNHSVLELANQRRTFHRRRPTEAFVLDGDERYFAPAMANGSSVGGIVISDLSGEVLPEWTKCTPHLRFRSENLRRVRRSELAQTFTMTGRTDIGCIALLPGIDIDVCDFAAFYSDLAQLVSEQTRYIIAGSAELALFAASALQGADPTAHVSTRLYTLPASGGGYVCRGIVIAYGYLGLPQVQFRNKAMRQSRLANAQTESKREDSGLRIIDYGPDKLFESVKPQLPFAFSSSAPLAPVMRERISQTQDIIYQVAELNDGILIPSTDAAVYYTVNRDGHCISDFNNIAPGPGDAEWELGKTNDNMEHLFPLAPKNIIRLDEAALPLLYTPMLHLYHGHFIFQCFPRVLILEQISSPLSKLIVPSTLRPYQKEMLNRVGFSDDRLVYVDKNTAVQSKSLIVPRLWNPIISPFTNKIYNRLIERSNYTVNSFPKRVFLSREAATAYRNMVNYDDIRIMLEERYQFVCVRPEQLSLDDEIGLFNEAEIVVGAQGAGLYNGCFARAGSTYISIVNDDYTTWGLASIAAVRGINIAYVGGESLFADSDQELPYSGGHSDFFVDPERVAEVVEKAISEKFM